MIRKICLGCILIFLSCSDSNEEDLGFDISLVYGKWYARERCETENYRIFQEDGTYVHRYSLNEDCTTNQFHTYESTANYDIRRGEIYYDFIAIDEIVINGTNDTSVSDEIVFEFYQQRIAELTENEMVIEIETRISGVTRIEILKLFKTVTP